MTATPVAATLITHVFVAHGGSVGSFLASGKSLVEVWPTPWDPTAWKLIGSFMATQLVLMRMVPGRPSYGPVTPGGNVPEYKANGFQCFALSLALFLSGAFVFDLYPGGIVYDYMPEIISALNVFSFIFCLFLDSMAVSVALQLVYVAKFFWWEAGYMCSIDIMHDRAGYYLCWGCLVWVPSVYTSPAMYLVQNPITLGTPLALAIFITGVLMVVINYDADRQRQSFRAANGKTNVWGHPAEFIVARYETEKGEKKESLLLTSGWWGLSRHFHYVPEVLAAVSWTIPALASSPVPYFYSIFLAILLTDRAYRDDARCAHKYRQDWKKYCERVPSLILPKLL
ncbi:H/ACA ribonucleoprotein complex subunit 2 [Phytophthora nicotianae]|uniref:7-dehydrocholesterol reductase n=1 Tax=Phytophthora nicotianae TaxID=4792 RepID=A0A0W8DM74_PHYNI|nr:H/ACA ribonucleoprotein complex subunit 2 [Phytophthora nicotianae]